MSSNGKNIKLSNGVLMPYVGLGTWQSSTDEGKKALKAAFDAGYRAIDTATAYQNEAEIGEVLSEYIAAGKLKRSDVFLTTKVWWTMNHPDKVEYCLRGSLKSLQTDYVDLYLVHLPITLKEDLSGHDTTVKLEDTWKAMEECYNKGLTKAIGLSNVTSEQIERVMKIAKVPVHNVQLEMHLHFAQFDLQKTCEKYNISMTSYATLGSPGRTNVQLPIGGNFVSSDVEPPLKNPLVLELAAKYKKTPAQVLLRHMIQRNVAVIPKSVNPERIKENFNVFDFELTKAEVDKLNKAPQGKRIFTLEMMAGHPEDPFKNER